MSPTVVTKCTKRMQFSLNIYSHRKFPVISNDTITTFPQLFLNFSFCSACWDPVTANSHLLLENWPKQGWGSRESLKCSSPKIWDWVFRHLDLFFIQILNQNKVKQVKLWFFWPFGYQTRHISQKIQSLAQYNWKKWWFHVWTHSLIHASLKLKTQNNRPPLSKIKYCQILKNFTQATCTTYKWPETNKILVVELHWGSE